jgi:flagellar biogenesis protein FliO
MKPWHAAICMAALAAFFALGAAAAEPAGAAPAAPIATQPASTAASSSFDSMPIRQSTRATTAATQAAAKPTTGLDLQRVFLSLGIVLGLILMLRLMAGRLTGRKGAGRASAAIQVVLRTPLSPRQQLVLIRVGRRLVLMTEGAGQNSVVCEISDPDEVASLVGQLHVESPVPATSPFGALLGRFTRRRDDEAAGDEPAADDSSRLDEANGEPVDPAVARTRRELDDLAGKVRSVTRQFKLG